MTSTSNESPADDVPEADYVEQAIDADPAAETAGEPGERSADTAVGAVEADEADVVEQETLAYGADDER